MSDGLPAPRRGRAALFGAAVLALVVAVGLSVRGLASEPLTTLLDGATPASVAAFPAAESSTPEGGVPTAAGALAATTGQAAASTAVGSPAGSPASTSGRPSPTRALTPSLTRTPSPTVTPTPTLTRTPSPPVTRTPNPTLTRTLTPTPTLTTTPVTKPPQILRVALNPTAVNQGGSTCTGTRAVVTVAVSAADGVTGAVTWQPAPGQSTTSQLKGSGNVLTGSVGPFATAGATSVSVTVRDGLDRGDSAAASLTVLRCGLNVNAPIRPLGGG